jgi:hypothetical protein
MKSGFFMILGLTGTFLLGACSSSIEEKPTAQANSTNQVNAANSAAAIPSENSNGVVVANGMAVTPQSGDANTVAASSSDGLQQPQLPGRLREKMGKMNSASGTVDAVALAIKNARPAPDNSTFTSYLTDAGYELRTFKNHPQLLKVEKRTANDGSQTVKIFLRNGKVIELPGKKIAVLSTASAASIVDAAGIAPAPQQQSAPGTTGAKKSTN